MNEEDSLRRFGLRPADGNLDEIREILRTQTALEQHAQGDGDTELMKLCCVQLFNVGSVNDIALIWDAKRSSFDAHHAIDAELLLGAALEATKSFLTAEPSSWAAEALAYLDGFEAQGGLAGFSVEDSSDWYTKYYQG